MLHRSLAVLLLQPALLSACLCFPATLCQNLAKAEVAFLSTPTAALSMSPKLFGSEPYLVRIDSAFKGLKPQERQLRVFVGRPNSCPVPQEIGKQYVYLARRIADSDVLETAACSGSLEVTTRDKRWVAEYSKAAKDKSNLLYGEWKALLKWPNAAPSLPTSVELFFKSPQHEFRITTEASGEFWHHAIPPGKYTVSASNDPRAAILGVSAHELPLT